MRLAGMSHVELAPDGQSTWMLVQEMSASQTRHLVMSLEKTGLGSRGRLGSMFEENFFEPLFPRPPYTISYPYFTTTLQC